MFQRMFMSFSTTYIFFKINHHEVCFSLFFWGFFFVFFGGSLAICQEISLEFKSIGIYFCKVSLFVEELLIMKKVGL